MNPNSYNYNETEEEIDLIDLFFYLLSKWKQLLICIVVGCVIGVGYSTYKNKKTTVEPIKSTYSPDETTLANMELANEYYQFYLNQLDYNENSLLMKLDTDSVNVGVVSYYITSSEDTFLVSTLFNNLLDQDSFYEDLIEAANLDTTVSYMREVVSCSISYESNTRNSYIETDTLDNAEADAIVKFVVYGLDENSCDKMLQAIEENVSTLDESLSQSYSYSCKKINQSNSVQMRTDIFSTQVSNIEKAKNYLGNIQNYTNAFTEDDLSYFKEVYDFSLSLEDVQE